MLKLVAVTALAVLSSAAMAQTASSAAGQGPADAPAGVYGPPAPAKPTGQPAAAAQRAAAASDDGQARPRREGRRHGGYAGMDGGVAAHP